MDTISSAEFRKTYAKLEQPVIVTANGHNIGVWVPASDGTSVTLGTALTRPDTDDFRYQPAQRTIEVTPGLSQAERDAILRKVNKG